MEQRKEAYAHAIADMDSKIEALREERDQLRTKRDSELGALDDRGVREAELYRAALDEWEA